MFMKYLALGVCALALAACGPSGCATTDMPDPGTVTLTAAKGIGIARGAHAGICVPVRDLHTAGILKGADFNTARAACIQADDALDGADAALKAGDNLRAAAQVNAAFAALDTADAVVPNSE